MEGFDDSHTPGAGSGEAAKPEAGDRSNCVSWEGYLNRYMDMPDIDPASTDRGFPGWSEYMRRDCLHIASAIAIETGLPVGRLTKRRQLAHAFVIIPHRLCSVEGWACLDWFGVRTIKRVRQDMHGAWGRLVLDADRSPINPDGGAMMEALGRPHIVEALRLAKARA